MSLLEKYHDFIHTLELTRRFENIKLEVHGASWNDKDMLKMFTSESSNILKTLMARGKYKKYNQGKSYWIQNQIKGMKKNKIKRQWNQQGHNF